MHPDHVAALVAEQVGALEATLTRLDLPVNRVELREQTNLLIGFQSQTTEGIPGTAFGEIRLIGSMREESLILALHCDDFDSQPPAVTLLDADESPLPPERWPHDPQRRGIVRGHHLLGDRKFFCRPGTREFHTHKHHEDHPWDRERESMSLDAIALGILYDLTQRWNIR
ncbi:MAG TPA: hypothetical protein VK480_10675 [Solirubrobacterales bacterium]|nr:hypothetical protein [Solirubrobacterales bacterium]